ncbi:MAG: NADH-quinone oxidoreductase subunit, partial [Bacteroidota bacterium]|nr:NADH-quinone oxidoreductase subunit [Bacteroidota bacterium]
DHHTDAQDIRNMGGLRKTMPLTYATFLIATLAISGVPFTSGFLSKDGILAATLAFGQLSGHWMIPLAGFGAAGMTAFYMFRLTIEAFHGKPKIEAAGHTKENNYLIVFPLLLLAGLSFFIFYSFNPTNASTGWFYSKLKAPATVVPSKLQFDFLVPYYAKEKPAEACCEKEAPQDAAAQHASIALPPSHDAPHNPEAAMSEHHGAPAAHTHHGQHKFEEQTHASHIPAMIASLLIAGGGILIAFCVYQFKLVSSDNLARQFGILYKGSFNKWWFDEIYAATFIGGSVQFSRFLAWFDNTFIDGFVNLVGWFTRFLGHFVAWFDNTFIDGLVNLTANITGLFGIIVRKVQTGKIQTYVAFAVVGLILLFYFVF